MAFNKGRESKRRSDQEQRNKSKFDSKSITRIVISLFVAIVAGIGVTSYESYLLSDKNVTSVVIAAADIKEGTLIDDTNVNEYFKMKDVNSSLVTDSTLKNLDGITGKASVNISKGEIVTTQRFTNTSSEKDKFENPVMLTYTVSEPTYAVGGSIREGDIVDIMETITKDEVKSSKLLVKDAYVLTAWDSSGNVISRDDTTSAAVTFTVYVERSDEEYYNPKNHDNISITNVVQQ